MRIFLLSALLFICVAVSAQTPTAKDLLVYSGVGCSDTTYFKSVGYELLTVSHNRCSGLIDYLAFVSPNKNICGLSDSIKYRDHLELDLQNLHFSTRCINTYESLLKQFDSVGFKYFKTDTTTITSNDTLTTVYIDKQYINGNMPQLTLSVEVREDNGKVYIFHVQSFYAATAFQMIDKLSTKNTKELNKPFRENFIKFQKNSTYDSYISYVFNYKEVWSENPVAEIVFYSDGTHNYMIINSSDTLFNASMLSQFENLIFEPFLINNFGTVYNSLLYEKCSLTYNKDARKSTFILKYSYPE